METHKQLKALLTRARNNDKLNKTEIVQIDKFIEELNAITKPKKFDINKYNKLLSEVVKWMVVGEKIIKDIIELCTSRK